MNAPCKTGDRIRLDYMGNDPDPIKPGSEGTVQMVTQFIGDELNISVKWDSGRTLGLVHPHDKFTVLPPKVPAG